MRDDPPLAIKPHLKSFGANFHALTPFQALHMASLSLCRAFLAALNNRVLDSSEADEIDLLVSTVICATIGNRLVATSTLSKRTKAAGRMAKASNNPLATALFESIEACLDCAWIYREFSANTITSGGDASGDTETSNMSGFVSSIDPSRLCIGCCRRATAWALVASPAKASAWRKCLKMVMTDVPFDNAAAEYLKPLAQKVEPSTLLLQILRQVGSGTVDWESLGKRCK